jgi:hypothetical protein
MTQERVERHQGADLKGTLIVGTILFDVVWEHVQLIQQAQS